MKKKKKSSWKKSITAAVTFLLIAAFTEILAFADMPTKINADSLKMQDSNLPQVTGYKAYTNHKGPVNSEGGDDSQFVILDVYYDSAISIESSEAVVSQLNITYGGTNLNSTAVVSVGEDGKSLHFEMQFPFAGMFGNLAVQSVLEGNNTLTAVRKAGTDTAVNFPEVYLIVSNGILLDSVSQTAGTDSEPASVTKKVNQLPSATRGAVQFIFLKNGKPVGTGNSNGANLVAHFHMYLSLDASTYCSYIEAAFNKLNTTDGMFEGYTISREGDTFTVTAEKPSEGEVLDIIPLAYPNDRKNDTDKTELTNLIKDSEKFLSENSGSYKKLKNEISIAKSYEGCIYYTQEQVDNETKKLQDILNETYTDTLEYSFLDSTTGVFIHANPGIIPYGAELKAETLTAGESFEYVSNLLKSDWKRFFVWDFNLFDKTAAVEPNGDVTVSLPIPEGFPQKADLLSIYHITDGKKTPVSFTISDKKLVFTTDSFSPFVIVDLTSAVTESTVETKTSDITVSGTKAVEVPVTGDNNLFLLWLFSLGGSAAIVLIVVITGIKNSNLESEN